MGLYLRMLQPDEDRSLPLFSGAEVQQLLDIYADYYPKMGFTPPWVAYLIIQDDVVVGTGSFTSKLVNQSVEIAYWTFPAYEGEGIASFACRSLMDIAFKADPDVRITAKTAPEKNASTRILEKHGFNYQSVVQDHEIGDAWLWEYE